ncbi:MAG: MerR family transcriptional regulator [Chloroflexi bacterium]|nr:MerR family transcriptional regulator [Chloroflexota bacterium]
MPTDPALSIAELASLAGVTPRTIRYYVSVGLLPAPDVAGRAARYGQEHLDRVRLVKRLQEQHLPLAEIRARLASLDPADIAASLAAPEPEPIGDALDYIRALTRPSVRRAAEIPAPYLPEDAAPPALERPMLRSSSRPMDAGPPVPPPAAAVPSIPTPTPATTAMWERIPLGPDVELHVRRPLSRTANKRVERLITIAKEILEDPS